MIWWNKYVDAPVSHPNPDYDEALEILREANGLTPLHQPLIYIVPAGWEVLPKP